MGVVEGTKPGLGLEGSGIVRRVGSAVRGLSVGDRVIVFDHGCFSTRLILPSKLCAKIPSDLSFEEAATLPCVYSTVIHALLTLGSLKKDNVSKLCFPGAARHCSWSVTDCSYPFGVWWSRAGSDSNLPDERCSGETADIRWNENC